MGGELDRDDHRVRGRENCVSQRGSDSSHLCLLGRRLRCQPGMPAVGGFRRYPADSLRRRQARLRIARARGLPRTQCAQLWLPLLQRLRSPPGSSPYSGVIAIFAARLAAKKGITIFGDGKQCRDFVYVKDVVRYLTAAMFDKPPTKADVFCICTGRTTTLVELADTLGQVLGVKADVSFGPERVGDIRTSFGNPSKLQERFGFAANVKLRDGLEQMGIAG